MGGSQAAGLRVDGLEAATGRPAEVVLAESQKKVSEVAQTLKSQRELLQLEGLFTTANEKVPPFAPKQALNNLSRQQGCYVFNCFTW